MPKHVARWGQKNKQLSQAGLWCPARLRWSAMSTFLVSKGQDVSYLQRDLRRCSAGSAVWKGATPGIWTDPAWDFAIGGKHRLHMPQGSGTGICSCVQVCADGTEGARWILALQRLPWAMASLGSWTSFSSFSSWTQEAAAIWARAEAQLAATPTETTNDCSSLSLFSNHLPKAPLQKTYLPTGHAPSTPQGCLSGHVSWDITPSGT